MSACVFCQIINGVEPAYIIHEDDQYIAFLDIYPYGTGHTLVIPKTHYQYIWDVPEIDQYMRFVKKVAAMLQKAFHTHTIYSTVFGEQVPHAHIHLLPPLPETQKKLLGAFEGIRQPELTQAEAQAIIQKITHS
jgi:histidine triad (HIT) family protein